MIETATDIKEKEKAIGNNDLISYLAGYPGISIKKIFFFFKKIILNLNIILFNI